MGRLVSEIVRAEPAVVVCEMLPELSFDRQLEVSPRRKVEEGPAGEGMS